MKGEDLGPEPARSFSHDIPELGLRAAKFAGTS